MPRGLLSFFLHLVRDGGRRRQSRRRRHGVGGLRRHNRHARDLRRFGGRRNGFRRRAPRLRHGARGRHGAGPSGASREPAPLPAWILAGPTAPNLYADEVMEPVDGAMDVDAVEPELAAPPPPHPCPVHGWGPWVTPSQSPPLHYVVQEEAEPVLPAEHAQPVSSCLPSPTPAHEAVAARVSSSSASLGLRLPARTVALGDVFDNGARSSTGPSAPRRWHIVPRAVLQNTGRLPGEWSPVNLGLAHGHSNGVASGAHLPGGTSLEEEDAAPGPSTSRR
ncbi:hypothetical protein D1007_20572 [Hordeum vulgare]|nr:hypothetical protein D1007_20572 [Hordeum vulgare]